jgi:class 3 adenylate cyclase
VPSLPVAESAALEGAIAALEAQRGVLGDAAIDAAIAALRQHAPRVAAVRRLRQVSILFVDVADSTRLLAQLSAEDADDVLGRAVQSFAEIVQRHGGQVLRFTGDGLKAAFGAVGAREDETAHAVQSGLDMLRVAEQHARRVREQLHGIEFGVRVGIHTGPVLLGGAAEAERSAIGHAVHLAARMEQSAPVGQLRISGDTWNQVRGLFRVQVQPPLVVKGHDEPLLTYLVLGPDTDPERAVQRGLDGVATPMVGREAELQRLLALHAAVRAERRLRTLTVLADAGVGKTRLRRELFAQLAGDEASGVVLQARAHPDSGLQPYGVLRQLLARWFAISDDLDAETARQRLVAGLAPWLAERGEERAPLVGQLIGLDFGASPAVHALGPAELRERAFAALTDALHARAAATALLLLFDDLHWADDASLDFLQHLARPAEVPVLILLFARPALLERRPVPLEASDGEHATLWLRPLDAEQGPLLATALLRHLADPSEALHNLLVKRAEGNPFYMEELVRMLIDDGVIDARTEPWRLRRGWQETARIPPTLVGVLQARLDALPADELGTLQQASVVGAVFWDAALAAIEPQAPARLPALQARALVVARETSGFADTREHAFHHQLLHEVTYETVLKAARREAHARVARWLSERVAERAGEFLGITAAHFERAGDSAQALEYYDRARANASRRFAHSAALAYGEAALRQPALTAPMWRYQWLMDRGVMLENLGRMDESRAALAELAAYADACDSDAMRADVLCGEMLAADRNGQAAHAEALAHRAVALAEPVQANGPAALAHGELAWLAVNRGDFDGARAHIDVGLRWARACALQPWREGGNAGYEHQLRVIGIEALLQQGRNVGAHQAIDAALASLPVQRGRERLSLMLQRIRVEIELGDFEQACVGCDEAVRQVALMDVPRLTADVANACADLAEAMGDLAGQERAALEAESLARSVDHTVAQALAWKQLGTVAAARDDAAAARRWWEQAAQRFDEQGMPVRMLEVRSRQAELDRRQGQVEAATQAALALLAAGRGEAQADAQTAGPWPLLLASDLVRCHAILADIGHPEAAGLSRELQRRLQDQLAQLSDEPARARLRALPHWQATLRMAAA